MSDVGADDLGLAGIAEAAEIAGLSFAVLVVFVLRQRRAVRAGDEHHRAALVREVRDCAAWFSPQAGRTT